MPPASRSASGSLVRGSPSAMLIKPSSPKAMADQPTNWRPPGPLRSGCRSVRQAISSSSSGAAYANVPIRVATPVWIAVPTAPGSPNQNSAAMMIALPTRNRPTPSRRSAGSRSRAEVPIARAAEPTRWASPNQIAASPPPIRAANDRFGWRLRDPARNPSATNPSRRPEREAGPGWWTSWPAPGCWRACSTRSARRRSVRTCWSWSCFRTTAAASRHLTWCRLLLATAVGKARGSPWVSSLRDRHFRHTCPTPVPEGGLSGLRDGGGGARGGRWGRCRRRAGSRRRRRR